jgi:hypothetical protein
MGHAFNAEEIPQLLAALITTADKVEPKLAERLKVLSSWIRKKSPGQIRAKPYVFALLLEVCLLAENWLILKDATQADWAEYRDSVSPSQQYWETQLFPCWFNEIDPKQKEWQRHLMAGDFTADDARTINMVCMNIGLQHGDWVTSLLLDLAMATDIIATGERKKPLCVQITSQLGENLNKKYTKWEKTLRYWQIERGLLLSFATLPHLLPMVAGCICKQADLLLLGNYMMEVI